jgi:hypothetical protein
MFLPMLFQTALLLDMKRVLVQGVTIMEFQILPCVKEVLAELLEERLHFLQRKKRKIFSSVRKRAETFFFPPCRA